MSDRTYLCNCPDFKNKQGLWVRSFTPAQKVCARTRAATVWDRVLTRCSTLGSINKFDGFQEFAEWCQEEYGYLEKELNGSYWGLDKDILSGYERVYSPKTCLFVPQCINVLFKQTSLGELGTLQPRGVNYCKDIGKYKVNATPYGSDKTQHIAVCDTREEGLALAAKAWSDKVRQYLLDDRIIEHTLLIKALNLKIELMEKYYA